MLESFYVFCHMETYSVVLFYCRCAFECCYIEHKLRFRALIIRPISAFCRYVSIVVRSPICADITCVLRLEKMLGLVV